MVAAMLIGMLMLHPVWMFASHRVAAIGVVPGAEIESFATATTMAIGMVAWMRYRGHEWRHISEMSAAIYAGLVVLFPALWLEMLDAVRVLVYGHMLMLIFMLLAMLWRRKAYVDAHGY
jgi:hypothetical protein